MGEIGVGNRVNFLVFNSSGTIIYFAVSGTAAQLFNAQHKAHTARYLWFDNKKRRKETPESIYFLSPVQQEKREAN
jgi:hypothetical protein